MPVISRALLRKRSEHNEGIISTMQELTLHQEELENINEVLGMTCRKIKILMLQNNIISRIENLVHLKELEYLNLALNNVKKIEGLQNCEFLYKIDLTVNFIDVDELEDSINHLVSRENLKDLYMMGNPSQVNWPGFASYVIAKLPQLQTLDGTEITRSLQILARQKLPHLEVTTLYCTVLHSTVPPVLSFLCCPSSTVRYSAVLGYTALHCCEVCFHVPILLFFKQHRHGLKT